MDSKEDLPIYVNLQSNYRPAVLDLSGKVPFELYLQVRRSVTHEADPRDLVILLNGSVFDLSAALKRGILELIDEADNTTIVCRHESSRELEPEHKVPTQRITESYITLPTDVRCKDRAMQSVPLQPAEVLRPIVLPGRRYKLRLRDNDLGILWWSWSQPSASLEGVDTSMLTESRNIVSSRPSWSKSFQVVSGLVMPPKLSINLSLVEQEHVSAGYSVTGSKARLSAIRVTITNTNEHSVTVKTRGDQPHLLPRGEIANPRSRVTAKTPDLQNFSIIDQETGEDLISNAPTFVSPVGGGDKRGWARTQFLTLAPQEQVTRLVVLPSQRLTIGRQYLILLRCTGCWWTTGTLDELFGTGNSFLKTLPKGPTVPMSLESDDEVSFPEND